MYILKGKCKMMDNNTKRRLAEILSPVLGPFMESLLESQSNKPEIVNEEIEEMSDEDILYDAIMKLKNAGVEVDENMENILYDTMMKLKNAGVEVDENMENILFECIMNKRKNEEVKVEETLPVCISKEYEKRMDCSVGEHAKTLGDAVLINTSISETISLRNYFQQILNEITIRMNNICDSTNNIEDVLKNTKELVSYANIILEKFDINNYSDGSIIKMIKNNFNKYMIEIDHTTRFSDYEKIIKQQNEQISNLASICANLQNSVNYLVGNINNTTGGVFVHNPPTENNN